MTYDPVQQRETALAHANEIRLARVNLARDVREHRTTLRYALDHECVQNAPIAKWVASALYRPGNRTQGQQRVEKVLTAMGVGPTRRVSALTPRRRDEFCLRVAEACPFSTAYRGRRAA